MGGQNFRLKHTICLKTSKKDTIFLKKVENILFLPAPGDLPLLPSPADAHDCALKLNKIRTEIFSASKFF
jgi:hypothetical protein